MEEVVSSNLDTSMNSESTLRHGIFASESGYCSGFVVVQKRRAVLNGGAERLIEP